jgi:hypothetical protein
VQSKPRVRTSKGTYAPVGIPVPGTPWRAYLNDKGYPQFTNGPYRKKYVHRVVIEALLGSPIPANKTVHHADFDHLHFCPGNLQLLDKPIHDAISASHRKFVFNNPQLVAAKLQKEYDEQVPEWVTSEAS